MSEGGVPGGNHGAVESAQAPGSCYTAAAIASVEIQSNIVKSSRFSIEVGNLN